MQLGYYLVYLADLPSLAQGLIAVREWADQLQFMLEKEKAVNAELSKEVDCYEEALRKSKK